MRLLTTAALAILLSTAAAQTPTPGPVKRALLVGINTYQPTGTTAQHTPGCRGGRCDLPVFPDLHGPVNDVLAMRDLLSSPKFAFAPQNIAVLTNPGSKTAPLPFTVLPAADTNHDALLTTIRHYLVELPHKGDTVVFFYAGHGSLRVNSKGTKLPMYVDGKPSHADSTLVPADAWNGIHDVRDRELTRIFNDALDKGVLLTVLLDSCHSGSFTRGADLTKTVAERSLGYDPDDIAEAPETLPNGKPKPAPAQRESNPALVFSAALQDQTAREILTGDPQNPEVHGAFTLALIQALQTLPADARASLVFRQVRAAMEAEGIANQNPTLDSAQTRLDQPLFGGQTSSSTEVRAASIAVSTSGLVTLDAGRLSGFDVGSEFTSIDPDHPITLRVQTLDGLTHAQASILSPASAKVLVPQVFKLTKWIPPPVDQLHFFVPPANLTAAAIQSAARTLISSAITLVDDPIEHPWTDVLSWTGTAWQLEHAAKPGTIDLGPTLTTAALARHLAPNAILWANLPPPQELAAKLNLHSENSLVVGVSKPADADYILASTLQDQAPTYAWVHKAEYLAAPRTTPADPHSPGCSTDSPYPVTTDWQTLETAQVELNKYAGLLAKVNGWLNLSKSEAIIPPPAYYQLKFRKPGQTAFLTDSDSLKDGDKLEMILTAKERVSLANSRFPYVLDIDCHGRGQLLYPYQSTGERFPNNADSPHEIPLLGADITIGKPFGIDTILMITTQEPLPDPSTLEFTGVSTRGAEGLTATHTATNPLDQLLSSTSAGTRGPHASLPNNWSIQTLSLKSIGN
jgi:hypothetical protein